MKIELDVKHNILEFELGDILVFADEYPCTHYLVVYDTVVEKYKLLSLATNKTFKGYSTLDDLIKSAHYDTDFKLIEVIKNKDVVLRRVANE